MPYRVVADFVHLNVEAKAGDVFPDDDHMVLLAPHLFEPAIPVDPEPEPPADTKEG